MSTVNLNVNGQRLSLDIDSRTLLADALRDAGLTGTHIGCDTTQCGCCTVLMDGRSVKSCTVLAASVGNAQVTTIEGLATSDELHPIQQAFVECHGLQCGFCTPGMIMTAACLLRDNPSPSEDDIVEALEGNLCRCTGYANIVKAVKQAAATVSAGGAK